MILKPTGTRQIGCDSTIESQRYRLRSIASPPTPAPPTHTHVCMHVCSLDGSAAPPRSDFERDNYDRVASCLTAPGEPMENEAPFQTYVPCAEARPSVAATIARRMVSKGGDVVYAWI